MATLTIRSRSAWNPVHFTLADQRHGVFEVAFDEHGTRARAEVGSGGALPNGSISMGSIGVLVDNALGYDAGRWAQDGEWLVTREIRIDFLGPFPAPGGVLTCSSTAEEPIGLAGFGHAVVQDEDGMTVARATDWVRYGTPLPSQFTDSSVQTGLLATISRDEDWRALRPLDALDAVGGQRVDTDSDEPGLDVPVQRTVANPPGNLHGGVTFAATVLCAELSLGEHRPGSVVTSAHVVHVSAGRPGATVRFRATFPHNGRSAQLLRVTAHDDDDRLVAYGTVTAQMPQ